MTDHERDPNEPISLDEERKKRREGLSLLTTEKAPPCYPCAWVVHEKTRTISCKKCERVADPFDVVHEFAHDFEGYARNRDFMRTEVARLEKKRAELKKSVESLRGMERRLLKDSDAIAEQVAAWLDAASVAHVKETYRPFVKAMARAIRDGEWRRALPTLKAARP